VRGGEDVGTRDLAQGNLHVPGAVMQNADQQRKCVVILGGGPSGLGVALGLVDAGYPNVVVVEIKDRLGGLAGSFERDGMTFDFGPHRLSPQIPEVLDRIKELLGDDLLEVSNTHAVFFDERIYHYPPSLRDFLNLSSLAMTIQFGMSWLKARLEHRIKQTLMRQPSPKGFVEILESNFGKSFVEKVARPMMLKVWGDVDFTAEFAAFRFALPTVRRIVKKIVIKSSKLNDSVFYYPRKGFYQIWDELGRYVESKGAQILLQASAWEIEVKDGRVASVTLQQDGRLQRLNVDWLVSTIPSPHFIALLNPNPFPVLNGVLKDFVTRGMVLIVVVINRPAVLPARVMIFPEKQFLFNRLSEQSQFSSQLIPPGRTAVLADIVTDNGSDIWRRANEELEQTVLRQIVGCGFFTVSDVEKLFTIRIPTAYPIPTRKRQEAQRVLDECVRQMPNVLITGRFGASDYNNSHNALAKGVLAAKLITGQMSREEWDRDGSLLGNLPIQD
jgi:protoporphyrinogen oxidase